VKEGVLLTSGTIVTGHSVLTPGWIEIDAVASDPPGNPPDSPPPRGPTDGRIGGRITGVGPGPPPRTPDLDLGELVLVPGFVDIHVHGGGGGAYTSHRVDDVLTAVTHHRRHGTTTTLASLVTADQATLTRSIRMLKELVAEDVLAGIHLEGPWLNPVRRGAHDPRYLSYPDLRRAQHLLDAGAGAVRTVTLAPELPGGLALIRMLVAAGVIAAIGHTDADFATTLTAIEAGATVATHLFNAMPPIHHRDPGPIVALLNDPRVRVEMIADGVHQHPALLTHIGNAVGAERIALVTDAMAASGMRDGRYQLGTLAVTMAGGVARVDGSGAIAGGSATMDQLFRAAAGPSLQPATLLRAAKMTALTPAGALGLAGAGVAGALSPGFQADLVALDRDLRVRFVMRRGRWEFEAPKPSLATAPESKVLDCP
jgi:N-acetylglucosamine-6-phosphate deacetylase